jgi:predicted RND superfamily exporter protein
MRLNLAARAGRWSAAHWKTATFGWIAFVVVALAIGAAVGTKHLGNNEGIPGESGRMEQILAKDFKQPAGETVLIQGGRLTTTDPGFRAAIDAVTRRVSSIPAVTNVRSPLGSGNGDQISADGHAAIVRFDIRGDSDKAAGKIVPVLAAVDRTKAEHPRLFIGEFGAASAEKRIGDSIARDFERAGLLSVVVTIAILVIAFGALVAAGIPLLLALSGVLATLGVAGGLARALASVGPYVPRFSALDGRSGSCAAHHSNGTIRIASSNELRSSDSASCAMATRLSRSHSSSIGPLA